jgi:hypothetical protein
MVKNFFKVFWKTKKNDKQSDENKQKEYNFNCASGVLINRLSDFLYWHKKGDYIKAAKCLNVEKSIKTYKKIKGKEK